ncbi:hypothetical protein E5675_15730 [Sphingopyxis sp. PAMC25046]|uniref:hypothetical protein n=1 Tax=Sphingopyxis sp. PAMC25046 TaxID=2565556 RepID=UPI00109DB623|nr:hypothetical protein [Sphingopyxis sp. PAMC25046]QCB55740.1 hypothetical protein E5675_15730 [Sphingopyxis sp. PAMC25046]
MEGHDSGPLTEAGTASAELGIVLLDGPNGVAVAMTPDAAERTGRSLVLAADEARRQRSDVDAARP